MMKDSVERREVRLDPKVLTKWSRGVRTRWGVPCGRLRWCGVAHLGVGRAGLRERTGSKRWVTSTGGVPECVR